MTTQNAIQTELAKLDEQWHSFLDSDKAIFHWRFRPTDQPLANTFIKVKEQFDENDPQLFVQLTVPFSNAQEFGWELAAELNRLMDEGKSHADEDSPQEDWQAPDLTQLKSGFHALFASCQVILDVFGDVMDNLVLAISPQAVKDPEQYRQWWAWACKVKSQYADEWPDNLKLLVIDHADKPFLLEQLQDQSQAMSVEACASMQAAVREIAEQADDGSDGGKLRVQLVAMNEAIVESDAQKLQQTSDKALPIAERNQWWDVWTTLLMTRAGGWLNMQRYPSALQDYRKAQEIASLGLEKETPGCDKLLLQAMLCEGTTLFLAEELEHAATAYAQTGEKAEALRDPWTALEAWRMASFSVERLDDRQGAWQHASKAFAVGKAMAQEQREQSTLPFVGQALLRLSPNQQVKTEVRDVFSEWLGKDWLNNVEKATA